MYRFNGYDGRLDRTVEGVLMVMEACQKLNNFKVRLYQYLSSPCKEFSIGYEFVHRIDYEIGISGPFLCIFLG